MNAGLDTSTRTTPARAARWGRRAAWALGALLLLVGLAWLAVPKLVQWQGEKRLSALLGRPLTMERVEFAPWSLTLTVHGLRIGAAPAPAPASAPAPAPAGEPLLAVRTVVVDAEAASLWRRAPVLKALRIEAPRVRVARLAPGHYDIDDLIARFTPQAPADPNAAPARFALNNLELIDGEARIDDRVAGRVHSLARLQLALPFVSNLPAEVETLVEPRLAFELNGADFDSGARSTPFRADRASTLGLRIGAAPRPAGGGGGAASAPTAAASTPTAAASAPAGPAGAAAAEDDPLDLAPYLAYLPADLPARPTSARIGGTLEFAFALAADGTPTLGLKGDLRMEDLAVVDRAGAPLARLQRLAVNLRDVQPLARRIALGPLRIDGLALDVRRDADGRTNLQALAPPAASAAPAPAPAPAPGPAASAARPGAAQASSPAPAPPWQLSIDRVQLAGASLRFDDAAVAPATAFVAEAIAFEAQALKWPMAEPVAFKLDARLAPAGATAEPARLAVDGSAGLDRAQVGWKLDGLALEPLGPYLAGVLAQAPQGTLAAAGRVGWRAGGDRPQLKFDLDRGRVERLRIGTADDAFALATLALDGASLDLQARRAQIASVAFDAPALALGRDAEGRWNVMRWLAAASAGPPSAAPAAPAARAGTAPWQARIAELSLAGGRLDFTDERPRIGDPGERVSPARLKLADVRLAATGLVWGDPQAAPAKLQVSAALDPVPAREGRDRLRVSIEPPAGAGTAARGTRRAATAPRGPRARVEWRGEFAPDPWLARGDLTLRRFPLHAFKGYLDNPLRVDLPRAFASYTGKLSVQQRPAGLALAANGELRLSDVSVLALPAADAPAVAPGTGATPDELLAWQRLALRELDFTLEPGARPQLSVGAVEVADLYTRLVVTEQGRFNLRDVAAGDAPRPTDAKAPAEPAPAADAAPLPIDLRIGGTKLSNGRIDFTDRFVKPNYSATLTELEGTLGGFRSGSGGMAELSLRGRAEGSALLEIDGRLDPTAQPLALDIRAKATDLELAPLSPYAGKYAGYAIERGKLSMEVAYKIEPDGRLDARNQIVLNQLTFGEKIDSPQATSLPVRLAVALLKDRNGIIDLNLPVSGSLKDPQFSVFGLIWRVLGNVIVKAVTAPFNLLAGLGGGDGGPQLQQITFRPGTASFAQDQQATLDKVVQALIDRPALKMTVTGRADPASEADALRAAQLEQQLLAERRRELVREGAPADTQPALDAAQRERLLEKLYDRTELPDKPRNLLGFAKSLPADEMARRLASVRPVTAEAMRQLAVQRGLAVRDALMAKGLASERLFLAAPKVSPAEGGDATPQASLSLSVD